MKKIISAIAASLFVACSLPMFSQVEFKIQRMANSEYYSISAIPQVTWDGAKSLVSTAQVTIKVPTGGFEVEAIQNLHTTARWRENGRCNAPKEDPEFDYIYFGLLDIGTAGLKFEKDKEVVLFAIKAAGRCTGNVALVDNKTDKFMGLNSMRVNIGNQMTVLGAGGDAWVGNRDGGVADCFDSALNFVEENKILIYPNPVLGNEVNISFDNKKEGAETAEMLIYDILGRRLYFEKLNVKQGINQKTVDVSMYPVGVYEVEIRGLTFRPMYEQIIRTQ